MFKKRTWVKCADCLYWYDNDVHNTTCPRCGSHSLKVITREDIDENIKAANLAWFACSLILMVLFIVSVTSLSIKVNAAPLGYDGTYYYQKLVWKLPSAISVIVPLAILSAKLFVNVMLYKKEEKPALKDKKLFLVSLLGSLICLILFVLIVSGVIYSRNYG